MNEEIISIGLPVAYFVNDDNEHILYSIGETKKFIDFAIAVRADSKEEAITKFWEVVASKISCLKKL